MKWKYYQTISVLTDSNVVVESVYEALTSKQEYTVSKYTGNWRINMKYTNIQPHGTKHSGDKSVYIQH